MHIKAIIIEDEPLALKKLSSFVDKINYLKITKTFDNAIDAIGYLKSNTVDLVFLDIQMEEFTGIQFLETIKQRPQVIVTTAYDKYALKGYELNICDYLLKPYTFERFVMAVDKVLNLLQPKLPETRDAIFIKTAYQHQKIRLADILYIEGMSEYLAIVTAHKKILTKQSFKEISSLLPANNFIRVHKSFMVAIDKIENIERNRIKINEVYIPISETYKSVFYGTIGVVKGS